MFKLEKYSVFEQKSYNALNYKFEFGREQNMTFAFGVMNGLE